MHDAWSSRLVELLNELSGVQDDLLVALGRKRDCLARSDLAGLRELQDVEHALIARLQSCHERRLQLLERAAADGLPGDSMRSLALAAMANRDEIALRIDQTNERTRFLHQQNLTNWVIAQRTLIHLSQLLEIIATGGRMRPTYEQGDVPGGQGALVDQAA
jgi:flagellar biosynthesis/type III secretory pathway chaperone